MKFTFAVIVISLISQAGAYSIAQVYENILGLFYEGQKVEVVKQIENPSNLLPVIYFHGLNGQCEGNGKIYDFLNLIT